MLKSEVGDPKPLARLHQMHRVDGRNLDGELLPPADLDRNSASWGSESQTKPSVGLLRCRAQISVAPRTLEGCIAARVDRRALGEHVLALKVNTSCGRCNPRHLQVPPSRQCTNCIGD